MIKKIKALLGKFSLFDVVLILILLTLTLSFFLFFYRKTAFVDIRVKVTDAEVLYARSEPSDWYADQFKIEDTEKDFLGKTVAKITAIDKFNVSPDKKAVYLDINLRALYDSRTGLYSTKGKTLIIGSPIIFNFSKVIFSGIVTETPETLIEDQKNTKYIKITALQKGANEIEPVILESINIGDRMLNSRGNKLLEILDIKLRPAQRITTNDAGELLLTSDPYYKDAILTVNVRAKKIDNEYYIFDYQPLLLGHSLPINLTKLSIYPVITGINY